MRALSTILAAAAVFAAVDVEPTPSRMSLHSTPNHVWTRAERRQEARLQAPALRIARDRRTTWSCQDELGRARTKAAVAVVAMPRSVAYLHWASQLWRRRAERCSATRRALTIRLAPSWQSAVRSVQRVFPGTSDWLLSCSGGEGGHGGFVMNRQGSGAGGWMQFMYSTYESNSDDAFAYARGRGFEIDSRTNDWRRPVGQALTAAYMRTRGWSHSHWSPSIDPACL